MNKYLFFASIILILVLQVQCQNKKKNSARGRRPKADCRLLLLEECMTKMNRYKNDSKSYELIKTSRGIDEICSNSQESLKCLSDFIVKCGTPIQQEMFRFALEQFEKSVDRFCKPGELRNDFLVHSPCIADKVLGKQEYKNKCNMPFTASVDKTDKLPEFDDRLDLVCCGYNRWENCLLEMTTKECSGAGKEALNAFMEKAFAGLSNMVCKQPDFVFTTDRCKSLYPPEGTVVTNKNTKNPISKYLTSYLGFLLSN
ncbi:uncharacterized protein LOC141852884 [Brevipalpus obovatus]|uniref:uncharacterized protein LOC141852884 n=1 Tax=Brevipalpus obovatus TaxID=246614 RepID=UPI003D9ECB25